MKKKIRSGEFFLCATFFFAEKKKVEVGASANN